jgi:UDP-N-acetylmuramoyl-L-alanyl-D-glutamate--2,6-diaminopimelate ligase
VYVSKKLFTNKKGAALPPGPKGPGFRAVKRMKLKSLIKGLDLVVKGSKEIDITGISSDSRTVAPGNLFIAKRGGAFDATQFVASAVAAGAVATVTDIYDPFLDKTQIIHPNPSAIEAKLAARYYGFPSDDLFVVGITGTKGKTTTSYLIRHLLEGLKQPCGLIGTVETIVAEHHFYSHLTTHEALYNQKWLKEMVLKGCKAVSLEVSSHGLDQGRVEEIDFDVGVFTNLYSDHLDYHKTIEAYAAAKKKLFQKAKTSILNADSPWAEFMGKGLTFGIEKGDLRASEIILSAQGTDFTVQGTRFHLPLIGRFNVYNALAAIAVGLQSGGKLTDIRDILAQFGSVPARLERIGNIFVDFAHTGEALESALQTLKEISKGKVIVVFGAGGNRDLRRRTTMGQAADKWADIAIVTNDNPRQEDPNEIAKQIVAMFKNKPLVELDRKKAIFMAIQAAGPNDLVLIAGKGHERVQIFAHETLPFDDFAVVKEALALKKSFL